MDQLTTPRACVGPLPGTAVGVGRAVGVQLSPSGDVQTVAVVFAPAEAPAPPAPGWAAVGCETVPTAVQPEVPLVGARMLEIVEEGPLGGEGRAECSDQARPGSDPLGGTVPPEDLPGTVVGPECLDPPPAHAATANTHITMTPARAAESGMPTNILGDDGLLGSSTAAILVDVGGENVAAEIAERG